MSGSTTWRPPFHSKGARVQVAAPPSSGALRFGVFRIDLTRRILIGPDGPKAIQRKPLEVLIFLASQGPRLVTRETLLDRFWSRSVHEESLTRCISTLRKLMEYEASRNEPPPGFPSLPDLPGGRYTDQRFFELENPRTRSL